MVAHESRHVAALPARSAFAVSVALPIESFDVFIYMGIKVRPIVFGFVLVVRILVGADARTAEVGGPYAAPLVLNRGLVLLIGNLCLVARERIGDAEAGALQRRAAVAIPKFHSTLMRDDFFVRIKSSAFVRAIVRSSQR
jgi:hypothetical protein